MYSLRYTSYNVRLMKQIIMQNLYTIRGNSQKILVYMSKEFCFVESSTCHKINKFQINLKTKCQYEYKIIHTIVCMYTYNITTSLGFIDECYIFHSLCFYIFARLLYNKFCMYCTRIYTKLIKKHPI